MFLTHLLFFFFLLTPLAVYESYTLAPTSILLATDIAARGLDIPSIDMVLHYDPPQDPAQFAHRCGRAGRCGRLGKAVALLSPTEGETFVEFIKIRGVFMRDYLEFNNNSTVIDKSIVTAHMRSLVLADRDTYDKSIRAFVSWVRAYKEHQAQYIFRLKDVDLGAVARSFSLFRMPSMPEIRGGGGNAVNLNGFLEDKSVNVSFDEKGCVH